MNKLLSNFQLLFFGSLYILLLPIAYNGNVRIVTLILIKAMIGILLFYIGVKIKIFSLKFMKNSFLENIMRAYYRFLFLEVAVVFFLFSIYDLYLFIMQYSNKPILFFEYFPTIALLISISIILIYFLFEILLSFTKSIIRPDFISIFSKAYLLLFIVTLLLAFILPDLIFSFLYNLVGSLNTDPNELKQTDYFYLSFLIHFALPLHSDAKIFPFINFINNNNIARLIQIMHINSCKLIDLTIVATTINVLQELLKLKRKEI